MKIFMILSLLFFKELICENLSDFNRSSIECEQKNRQLLLENGELKNLRSEIASLKKELYEIRGINGSHNREKRNALSKRKYTNFGSCGVLANNARYFDRLFAKACNAKRSNGKWTVIQRRQDGSVDFYRGWNDYKVGFGAITGEFFIGLDNLHWLTTCARQELRIEMEDFENEKRYATYDFFKIGNECEKYALKKLGEYEGDAGDSLSEHVSQKFTTFDQDNDDHEWLNCARRYRGAWWYNKCHHSNLNGEYGNNEYGEGINWLTFHMQEYSLKKVEMKIRPKSQ